MSSIQDNNDYDEFQSLVFNLSDAINENDFNKLKINNLKLLELFDKRPDFLINYEDIDYTPLSQAVSKENFEFIKYLILEGKADVNHQDWLEQNSALMIAVEIDNIDIVRFLLEIGKADPDLQDYYYNETALMKAVKIGNIEVVKLLIENNSNLAIENINGETALMEAMKIGNIEIIKLLENNTN